MYVRPLGEQPLHRRRIWLDRNDPAQGPDELRPPLTAYCPPHKDAPPEYAALCSAVRPALSARLTEPPLVGELVGLLFSEAVAVGSDRWGGDAAAAGTPPHQTRRGRDQRHAGHVACAPKQRDAPVRTARTDGSSATSRGVRPWSLDADGSAPYSSSARTALTWPFSAASCSGVSPCGPRACTSAPACATEATGAA